MEPHSRRAWEAPRQRAQLREGRGRARLVEAADRGGDERLRIVRAPRRAASSYSRRADTCRPSRWKRTPAEQVPSGLAPRPVGLEHGQARGELRVEQVAGPHGGERVGRDLRASAARRRAPRPCGPTRRARTRGSAGRCRPAAARRRAPGAAEASPTATRRAPAPRARRPSGTARTRARRPPCSPPGRGGCRARARAPRRSWRSPRSSTSGGFPSGRSSASDAFELCDWSSVAPITTAAAAAAVSQTSVRMRRRGDTLRPRVALLL